MKKLEYTVEFVTPAFLGNAEQSAQWRTPPFKTMLRQWWRVLNAKRFNYDEAKLRTVEGDVFGKALNGESSQSKVRIKLIPMTSANPTPWSLQASKPIDNPSLEQVYIGYGPITTGSVKTALPIEQKAKLVIIFDDSVDESEIKSIVYLCDKFATMGSRSKNGWGSLRVGGIEGDENFPVCNWREAMQRDWSQGIGADAEGNALIWKTKTKSNWKELMRTFQQIRKELINNAASKNDRHLVSYPVTKNNKFGSKYRCPSQILFKARKEADGIVGYIYHMPHKLPLQDVSVKAQELIFEKIHSKLNDKLSGLTRVNKIGI